MLLLRVRETVKFASFIKKENESMEKALKKSINQLSKCLISVSTDSKAHHPVRKA